MKLLLLLAFIVLVGCKEKKEDGAIVFLEGGGVRYFERDTTPIFQDNRGLHGHGYVILKDSRPGIPPLRLAIYCPYNNKDTIFILDSAAYYGKPTKLGGEYYIYGNNHDFLFGVGGGEGVIRQHPPETQISSSLDSEGGWSFGKLNGDICEPTNVTPDSLIKWHQDRTLYWMKVRKKQVKDTNIYYPKTFDGKKEWPKQGGLIWMGAENEPNLPWQFSDGTFETRRYERRPAAEPLYRFGIDIYKSTYPMPRPQDTVKTKN